LLGAAIARRCADDGWRVTVLSRRRPDERTARLVHGARHVFGDAADPSVLRAVLDGATHVVDALGVPHPAASASAPRAQFDLEIPVLLGVLEELRRHPQVTLTYLSSGGAIYGDAPHLPVGEDTGCRPLSPYGEAKLAAEACVLAAADDDGLEVRILRVANAYGARQRPRTGQGVVATMLRAAQTGTPVTVFGDGTAVRDYVDARDVAIAVAATRPTAGGPSIVNVGTGVGHRVLDVRAIVEEVTGTRLELRFEPRRSTDVGAVVLDVSRLGALLDWHPTPLLDGVADAWRVVRTQPLARRRAHAGAR
jgi:UDP-glucose 4-epimerase